MELHYDTLEISGMDIEPKQFNIHNFGWKKAVEYYNELVANNKEFNIILFDSTRPERHFHKVETVNNSVYIYPHGHVKNKYYTQPLYWLRKLKVFKYTKE